MTTKNIRLQDVKQTLPLFIALTAAGLAANYFSFELFFNIHFVFGSVFAIYVLQLLGLRYGVLAAALISSITWQLWNHPYAIIIMTAEVLCAGLLARRKNIGIAEADAIYWVCIGMPLVYFFYGAVMHLPTSTVTITMVKQALNGIANALAARLIFMAFSFRITKTSYSLHELVFNVLGCFVLAASLTLLVVQSTKEFVDTDRSIRGAIGFAKERVSDNVEKWLKDHVRVVDYLARKAEKSPVPQMQQQIDQAHAVEGDFLRVGLLDRKAIVVAFSPLIDEFGQPNIGRNYADRPFITELKEKLSPMLSDVEMGRVGKPEPRAAILVPVVTRGQFDGYAIGVLDLQALHEVISMNAKGQMVQGLLFTLVDSHDRVIVTNRTDLLVMDTFNRGAGESKQLEGGIFQWLPSGSKNVSVSDRWKNSYYVAESRIGDLSEWRLILELPIAPFQKKLFDTYGTYFGEVFVMLVVALLLAKFLSRRLSNSLEKLSTVSADVPSRLLNSETIVWPRSSVVETQHLINNFMEMTLALAHQFKEIRNMNLALEERVRERTQELQDVTANLGVGVYVINREGKISFMNPMAEYLWGWTKEEMNEKDAHALIHYLRPDGTPLPLNECRMHDVITRKTVYISSDEVFVRKDGTVFPVSVITTPLLKEGAVIGSVTAFRDITEEKKMEEEVHKARKLESVGVLAGGIAHDFNNLLTGIMGNISLARMYLDGGTPERVAAVLDNAEEASEAARELSFRLLTFSKGGDPVRKISSIEGLLRKSAALALSGSNVAATFALAPDLCPVEIDEGQMLQVFNNIFINAKEAMPRGGTVTISGENITITDGDSLSLKNGLYAKISITDTGVGISRLNIDRIFDPYFSTKGLGSRKGTGLGLSICMSVIRKHEGHISVESREGVGTTFHLWLPASPTGRQTAEKGSIYVQPVPKKILFMDDDQRIRSLVENMMQFLGYDVTFAGSGGEAIELYSRTKAAGKTFDVVILDLTIQGGMGGDQAVKRLLEIDPDVKAVITSGYADSPVLKHFREYGFVAAIAKPYRIEELKDLLEELLPSDRPTG